LDFGSAAVCAGAKFYYGKVSLAAALITINKSNHGAPPPPPTNTCAIEAHSTPNFFFYVILEYLT
jgi:hypothetical protein